MRQELEKELVSKYPKILRDYHGDCMKTCMAWGLECDDGWYRLLDGCMENLQYFCDVCSRNGKEVQVVADQIKEKFGTLSFYFHVVGANDVEDNIIGSIIRETERQSAYVCQTTGKDGVLCSKGGWYMTLCREEARKLGYVACNPDIENFWKKKDAEKLNT